MKSKGIVRHSLTVRLVHWLVALSGIALVFTGMGELPMYKRYNLIKVPGLAWCGDFEFNLVLHYLCAIIFTMAVLFHLVYHWRRREFAAMPRKGDAGESLEIVLAMMRGKEEPPHDKFLAEQRLAYLAIGVTSLLLVGTGLVKTYKNLGVIVIEPTTLQIITLVHTAGTMVFMLLIVVHLAAFALKANWPLLPSMFHGRVSRTYAEKRHVKWRC